MLLGFEQQPDPDKLYAQLDELGAVVLYERQQFG